MPALVAALAVLVLAACGGSRLEDPDVLVQRALDAANGASSVHVRGTTFDGAERVSFDLVLTARGTARGTVTERGMRWRVARAGGKTTLDGPPGGDPDGLDVLLSKHRLLDEAIGAHGILANRGEVEYRGRRAIRIDDTTQGGTLYVAAEGEPYPIALIGGGTLRFDDWR